MGGRLTDEKIALTMLQCGTVKRTAEKLDCDPRTLYKRMKQDSYQKVYQEARDAVFKDITGLLVSSAAESVTALRRLILSPSTADTVKVSAAHSLLSNTLKYAESADVIERLEALEKEVKQI